MQEINAKDANLLRLRLTRSSRVVDTLDEN